MFHQACKACILFLVTAQRTHDLNEHYRDVNSCTNIEEVKDFLEIFAAQTQPQLGRTYGNLNYTPLLLSMLREKCKDKIVFEIFLAKRLKTLNAALLKQCFRNAAIVRIVQWDCLMSYHYFGANIASNNRRYCRGGPSFYTPVLCSKRCLADRHHHIVIKRHRKPYKGFHYTESPSERWWYKQRGWK